MPFQVVRTVWRAVRRPRVFDITLVVLIELACLIAVVFAAVHNRALLPLILATMAATAPLVARRRRPIAVAVACVGLELCTAVIAPPAVRVPQLIALYSMGRYASGSRIWVTAGVVAVAYGAVIGYVVTPYTGGSAAVGVVGMVVLGQLFRLRHELRERHVEERAERAVRAERRRIARELHDVVAHHISVIKVLVGAGRTALTADPERAREVLVAAERTAGEAMTEMRQLLHVLRAEDADEPDNHAEVGTAGLPALVEQASRSGVPARLEVTGAAVPLPAAVDHAIYRIAQEALTNTRKHAPGARATVRLAYLGDEVEVEVLDDGGGGGGAPGDGVPGHGLRGMAERVALCGGRLWTGRRPEGGFRVHARIPLAAEPRRAVSGEPGDAADSIPMTGGGNA